MSLYALVDRFGLRRLATALYRVEVVGGERIPAGGGCILACNHESVVDPFVLALATTREVRYMAKAELFERRWMAAILRTLGSFPVERGRGDLDALVHAERLVRSGDVVAIFPQGTSKQHAVRPWHRGAARLALVTGAPLVPVHMTGTRAWPLRTRVRIAVAEPIHVAPAKPTIVAARSLTEQLKQAVRAA
jgi:1-acyl-sn-glycerol-3-phosphate acyltransferase